MAPSRRRTSVVGYLFTPMGVLGSITQSGQRAVGKKAGGVVSAHDSPLRTRRRRLPSAVIVPRRPPLASIRWRKYSSTSENAVLRRVRPASLPARREKQFMKNFIAGVTLAGLLVATTPLSADLTITARATGKGVGQVGEGQTLTYIKGLKMRTDAKGAGQRRDDDLRCRRSDDDRRSITRRRKPRRTRCRSLPSSCRRWRMPTSKWT